MWNASRMRRMVVQSQPDRLKLPSLPGGSLTDDAERWFCELDWMIDRVRELNYHRSRRAWCAAWGSGQPGGELVSVTGLGEHSPTDLQGDAEGPSGLTFRSYGKGG